MAAQPSHEVTFAQVILEMARVAGAGTAFGLPGVQNLSFWAASGPDIPSIITVRHEQTTVYGADGWARATGRLGLALTTTGPGAANAVAAFGEAAMCGSPVLLVSSEVPTRYQGTDARVLHQSPDQAGLFRPLAKAVFTPRTADQVLPAAADAIAIALAAPRGPVYLDVPADLLSAPAGPARAVAAEAPPRPAAAEVPAAATAPTPPAVAEVAGARGVPDVGALAAAIRGARRVAIWAGGGVVAADAETQLRMLAERLGAAVVTTWAGRGLLAGHPLLVDVPIHEPEAGEVLAGADLLLVVGSAFEGMATKNGTAPLPAIRAVINLDPNQAASSPELALVADVRPALAALLDADLGTHEPWGGDLATLRKTVLDRIAADPRTAESAEFLASVEAAVGPDTVVVCDMAVGGYWAGSYLPARRPRVLQYPVGWGTLGFALPAAVGAGAAGSTLAVCGDGGLMFGVAELATLAQERLPVTVLVVDDAGYGMLRYDQDHAGAERRGVDLHTPDLVELAHAFGVPAIRVDSVGEPLREALTTALAANQPRLVTVRAALYPPRTTSPRWNE